MGVFVSPQLFPGPGLQIWISAVEPEVSVAATRSEKTEFSTPSFLVFLLYSTGTRKGEAGEPAPALGIHEAELVWQNLCFSLSENFPLHNIHSPRITH